MRELLVVGAFASWMIAMVALILLTKRGNWDHTSARTRMEARRLRPVARVAGVMGLASSVGWALTL